MNYITKLQLQVTELEDQLSAVRNAIIELQMYYTSEKFHGLDNDHAHVSTDVLPRLGKLKEIAQSQGGKVYWEKHPDSSENWLILERAH